MANVELIIKIDKELYDTAFSINNEKMLMDLLLKAVRNGVILPKGHGRIADMDKAIKCIEAVEGEDANWAINLIEWACSKRTIIEADKESEK